MRDLVAALCNSENCYKYKFFYILKIGMTLNGNSFVVANLFTKFCSLKLQELISLECFTILYSDIYINLYTI